MPIIVEGLLSGCAVMVKFANLGEQLLFADEDIQIAYKMTSQVEDQLRNVRSLLESLPKRTSIAPWRKRQIEELMVAANEEVQTARRYLAIDNILENKATDRGVRAMRWVFLDRARIVSRTPLLQMNLTTLSSTGTELQVAIASASATPSPVDDLPSYIDATRKGYTIASKARLVKGMHGMDGF